MPDEEERRCDQCNGYESYNVICDVCDGEGIIGTEECPECLGKIRIFSVCSECDDEGEIIKQCSNNGCVGGQIEKECDDDSPHTWTSYTCSICGDAEWNIRGDDGSAMRSCLYHEATCKPN